MTENKKLPIALALSGGGIRAMVFYLGLLKYMAERELLEQVVRISTVSGGSLIIGLVYAVNNFQWPGSKQFTEETLERIREKLCARSMSWGAFRQLVHPVNWRFLLSRANLLARELKKNWGMDVPLSTINK